MTQQTPLVIGALTPEERAIIDERDGYRANFQAALTDAARAHWLSKMEDATRRYDQLRTARWERSEVVS